MKITQENEELAKRVESLEANMAGRITVPVDRSKREDYSLLSECLIALGWGHRPDLSICWVGHTKRYTKSSLPDFLHNTDAAISLIPKKYEWELASGWGKYFYFSVNLSSAERVIMGVSPIPSRAILAGLLKLKREEEGKEKSETRFEVKND